MGEPSVAKERMPTHHTRLGAISPYLTKDGSQIRELMHPTQHGNSAQSLAEATVPAGGCTRLHRHLASEELYHITAGRGRMYLGAACFEVEPGDTVLIAPGTAHKIEALGDSALVVLCCCSPAYAHEDTELLE
jgi:mannose-6-phosphate isomerase-like protein (cupin superfamily)